MNFPKLFQLDYGCVFGFYYVKPLLILLLAFQRLDDGSIASSKPAAASREAALVALDDHILDGELAPEHIVDMWAGGTESEARGCP